MPGPVSIHPVMPLVADSYCRAERAARGRARQRSGMMFFMWVYMVTWIVQDGAPELGRGSYLAGVGLRADCLSVGAQDTSGWHRGTGGSRLRPLA